MPKPIMIVVEGSNGSGKSSVMQAIESFFNESNLPFVHTREPGGTPFGEKIRDLLLDKDNEICKKTELLLFYASRIQNLEKRIIPALNQGMHVLCDRFESSTISFQHYGRGLPLKLINDLNDIALEDFRPDITIVLDLDPRIGLERIKKAGGKLDRIEDVDIEFLDRARKGYLDQAQENPNRFAVIDASKSLEEVTSAVLKLVQEKLKE